MRHKHAFSSIARHADGIAGLDRLARDQQHDGGGDVDDARRAAQGHRVVHGIVCGAGRVGVAAAGRARDVCKGDAALHKPFGAQVVRVVWSVWKRKKEE